MKKPEKLPEDDIAGPKARHKTTQVKVGHVAVGGGAPIVVQSMTNTDTADIDGTIAQVAALSRAGSEMVRITVDREEAAAAVPHIRDGLRKRGINTPLIGDFHYIGHKLLAEYPACAEALDKYRINPGNVGFKNKRDTQFADIIEIANKNDKPVRIGANWGSLDQELLTKLMDENTASANPRDARAVTREAMVQSALLSAARAQELGMPKNKMILSAKVSAVQDLIAVYQELARRSDYAIHLGLTEAGMGSKGIVASSAALGILLQDGIGDTIRISLTPEPGGDRTLEVQVAQELLQTMGFRTFVPLVAACPGCGRTTSTTFQELARSNSGFHPRGNAGLEDALSRRRGAQRRGDGLHRQRPRRIQACQYRHLAARHRRSAGSTCVRRRQEVPHPAWADHCHRLQGAGDRLHRPALWRERKANGRGGVNLRGPDASFRYLNFVLKASLRDELIDQFSLTATNPVAFKTVAAE